MKNDIKLNNIKQERIFIMATDTLKNRIRISTTLKPETNDLLKKYSQSTQIPLSKIIENAIIKYISEGK